MQKTSLEVGNPTFNTAETKDEESGNGAAFNPTVEPTLDEITHKITRYPDWEDIASYVDVDEPSRKLFVSDLKSSDHAVIGCLDFLERCGIDFDTEVITASEMNKRVEERNARGGISGLKVDSDIQQVALNLFSEAAEENASDIHIEINDNHTEIEFRINGDLERQTPITKAMGELMIQSIMNSMLADGAAMYKLHERQDGRVANPKYLPPMVGSIRVATGPIEGSGRLMVLRLLYKDTNSISGNLEHRLQVLGYNQTQIKAIRAAWDMPSGINLMSGPTGSGKSTTLKHILECKKNEHPEENFLSIEDPPEYRIVGVRQISADKSKFSDVINFTLRADPDKLLVGEIRDAPTLSMAVKVALSGHGVSASVHANGAFGIMKRLVDMMRSAENPEPINTLADDTVITGLIFQKLVKINCPQCSIPLDKAEIRLDLRQRINKIFGTDTDSIRFANVLGCDHEHCRKGIIRREVVAEVVPTNEQLMDILKKDGDYAAKRYWKEELGGLTVIDHAIEKIRLGLLSPDNAEKEVGHLTANLTASSSQDEAINV